MNITSISLENLKGRTCSYDLAPTTVIVGAPFSGKTAVLDAIKVGLLGYHPKLGKRPGDTFKLATGSAMSVALTFDGGISLSRSLASTRGTVNLRTTGEGPEVSAVLFDLNTYLSMSAKERLAYVAAQVRPGDDDDFNPMTVLTEMREQKWEAEQEDADAAIKELQDFLDEMNTARISEEVSLDSFFADVIAQLTEKAKAAKAGVAQTSALIQGTSEMSKTTAPPVNVERELKKAREALEKLRGARTAYDEAKARWDRHHHALARLEKYVAENQPKDMTAAKEAVVKLTRELDEWIEKHGGEDVLNRRVLKVRQDHRVAENQLNQFTYQQKVRTDHRAALDEEWKKYDKLTACPYCKSSRSGWREHLHAEHLARVKEADEALAQHTDEAKAKLEKPVKESATLLATLETQLGQIRAVQSKLAQAKDHLAAIEEENKSFRDEAVKLQLMKSEGPPPEPPAMPSADELAAASALVAELESKQRLFVGEQAKAGQAAKAAKQLRESKAKQEVFGRAHRALFKLHEDTVHKGVKDLMATARKFTDGLMPGELEFLEGGIGYMKRGTWVSHEVFSGTETALAYAGFAVALNQQAPLRIVVMDELWCAGDMAPQVVERMAELVRDGVIDQFIGAAPTPSMANKFKKAGATVLAVE